MSSVELRPFGLGVEAVMEARAIEATDIGGVNIPRRCC